MLAALENEGQTPSMSKIYRQMERESIDQRVDNEANSQLAQWQLAISERVNIRVIA